MKVRTSAGKPSRLSHGIVCPILGTSVGASALVPRQPGRFTVYAPEHPGTTPGRPDDIYLLDDLWDLVLCYDELLEGLGWRRRPS